MHVAHALHNRKGDTIARFKDGSQIPISSAHLNEIAGKYAQHATIPDDEDVHVSLNATASEEQVPTPYEMGALNETDLVLLITTQGSGLNDDRFAYANEFEIQGDQVYTKLGTQPG